MRIANGVNVERVSSQKQGLQGDSHNDQEKQLPIAIARVEGQYNVKIKIVRNFQLTESATVELELQPLYKILQECKKMKDKPEFVFLKSIDRASRAGGTVFLQLFEMFKLEGIMLIDVYGIIQNQTINTLQHLELSFPWSTYNPAYIGMYMEAERVHSEARDILTRLIGAEINYKRLGYSVGQPPFGLKNITVVTSSGKRKVWAPDEKESKWIIRILQLRAEGIKTDRQIMEEVNALGFRTRTENVYDRNDKTKVVGTRGGKQLETSKQIDNIVENLAYAGIVSHSWLMGSYIRAQQFLGLVSIDLWNKANIGKNKIIIDGAVITIVKGKIAEHLLRKNKHNPLVPYKNVVLCPICDKPFYGSAPLNGSGVPTPTYHCNRKHKYFGVNAIDFHKTLYEFVSHTQCRDDVAMKLRKKS